LEQRAIEDSLAAFNALAEGHSAAA
jgi:hypothetical protein